MLIQTRKIKVAKGGFITSIMAPFAKNAAMLTPLALTAGYKLINSYKAKNKSKSKKKVRKNLRKSKSKGKSRRIRQ